MKYKKSISIDYNTPINKTIKKIKSIEGVETVRLNNDELIIVSNVYLSDDAINNVINTKEESYKEETFYFDYIDCPNCANKAERALNNSKKIKEAKVVFLSNKIIVKHNENDIYDEVVRIVNKVEKDAIISRINEKENKNKKEHNSGLFSKKQVFIFGVLLFVIATIINLLGNKEILSLFNLSPLLSGLEYLIPLFILYLSSYLLLSYDLIYKSIYGILHKDFFNESLLMVIASLGAIVLSFIGEVELFEACAVVLIYKIGEKLQDRATEKSKNAIKGLISINVDKVTLTDGRVKNIDDVLVGDKLVIKVGEKIPLDGRIIKGHTSLDMKILTGESEPIFVSENQDVLSGSLNLSNVIEIELLKENSESTLSKVRKIIDEASEKKAKSENFITIFAHFYTPIILLIALIVLIIELILLKEVQESINSVFSFLVISCPCSLVISIPLAYFASIGRASKEGILVKGGNYLEALCNVEKVVFDKTGTLTEGAFEIVEINNINISQEEFIDIVCKVEVYSNHPIAKFLVSHFLYSKKENGDEIIEEFAGLGVKYQEKDQIYLVGNEKLMEKFDINYNLSSSVGSHIYVSKNGEFIGNIVIRDRIKPLSKIVIDSLKSDHVEPIMLTGDKKIFGDLIAKELGINEVRTELLPQDKYEYIDSLVNNKKKNIVYVGDGINDTPSLRRSDVGIALGGIGVDLAKEAADIVIMNDDISKVKDIITLSKKTKRIMVENIVFILFTKILAMIISLIGILDSYTMLLAIFADVGVCLICILNSLRLLKINIK